MLTDIPDGDPTFQKFQKSLNPKSDKPTYHYKVVDDNGTVYYFYNRNDMQGIIFNPIGLVDSINHNNGRYKNYTAERGNWTYADVRSDKDYYPEIKDYWLNK